LREGRRFLQIGGGHNKEKFGAEVCFLFGSRESHRKRKRGEDARFPKNGNREGVFTRVRGEKKTGRPDWEKKDSHQREDAKHQLGIREESGIIISTEKKEFQSTIRGKVLI